MVCRCLVTLPGHWWMDLNGITASLSDEDYSTSISANQTELGPPRPLLSTTDMLLVIMVSPVIKETKKSEAGSPATFTGVLLTRLYRYEERESEKILQQRQNQT